MSFPIVTFFCFFSCLSFLSNTHAQKTLIHCQNANTPLCEWMCMRLYLCVYVRERERERERVKWVSVVAKIWDMAISCHCGLNRSRATICIPPKDTFLHLVVGLSFPHTQFGFWAEYFEWINFKSLLVHTLERMFRSIGNVWYRLSLPFNAFILVPNLKQLLMSLGSFWYLRKSRDFQFTHMYRFVFPKSLPCQLKKSLDN